MMVQLGPWGQHDQHPQCLDAAPLETRTLQPQTASLAGSVLPQAPVVHLAAQAHEPYFHRSGHRHGTGMMTPPHVVDSGNHPAVWALPCYTCEPMSLLHALDLAAESQSPLRSAWAQLTLTVPPYPCGSLRQRAGR